MNSSSPESRLNIKSRLEAQFSIFDIKASLPVQHNSKTWKIQSSKDSGHHYQLFPNKLPHAETFQWNSLEYLFVLLILLSIKNLPEKFIVIRLHYWIGEKPVRRKVRTGNKIIFRRRDKKYFILNRLTEPSFTSLCNKFVYKVIKANEKQRNE